MNYLWITFLKYIYIKIFSWKEFVGIKTGDRGIKGTEINAHFCQTCLDKMSASRAVFSFFIKNNFCLTRTYYLTNLSFMYMFIKIRYNKTYLLKKINISKIPIDLTGTIWSRNKITQLRYIMSKHIKKFVLTAKLVLETAV